MKTWKNLFIKEDSPEQAEQTKEEPKRAGFPVKSAEPVVARAKENPFESEIAKVYEDGLDKINMPGYDFYEFYNSINAAGSHSEATFKMAFQMGKTMDKTITPEKLASDAEYYISKIGDVHQAYSRQGEDKLNSLNSQLDEEKNKLLSGAKSLEAEIKNLKDHIRQLESSLADTKNKLGKIDQVFEPQKETIKQKLVANDKAMEQSIHKINAVKEGILKFLKS